MSTPSPRRLVLLAVVLSAVGPSPARSAMPRPAAARPAPRGMGAMPTPFTMPVGGQPSGVNASHQMMMTPGPMGLRQPFTQTGLAGGFFPTSFSANPYAGPSYSAMRTMSGYGGGTGSGYGSSSTSRSNSYTNPYAAMTSQAGSSGAYGSSQGASPGAGYAGNSRQEPFRQPDRLDWPLGVRLLADAEPRLREIESLTGVALGQAAAGQVDRRVVRKVVRDIDEVREAVVRRGTRGVVSQHTIDTARRFLDDLEDMLLSL